MTDVPPPPLAAPPSVPPPATAPPPPPPNLTARPPTITPPPGYVAYGNAPAPAASLRRVAGLAKAIVVLTAIGAVGAIATTVLTASVAQDARDYLAGRIDDDQFRSANGPLNAVQLLTGLALIATFVLTVIWMYRLAANVRAFQRRTTWHPLFAIFGWLMPPFVLYIVPTLMLRELWKASDQPDSSDPDAWRSGRDNPLVWLWFLLYGVIPLVLIAFSVGSLVNGGLATDLESLADTLDDFRAINVVSMLVTVAAAVVWILLVRQLTSRHVALTNER